NVPPSMTVPGRAVVIEGTWHVLQPMLANKRSPARTEAVFARTVSRGGHLGAPDELRKKIDIGEAEIVRNVLRVCRHLANGRGVLRAQSVGHAHFVQVGVADEREQTAVLVFPAETPNTRLAWCLQNRHLDGFAVDPARADFGLACGD